MSPLSCPACGNPLTVEHHAGHYGRQVELDVCHHCNALWFDRLENMALSASGVLSLIRSMHAHARDDRRPLPEQLACPRCSGRLRTSRRSTKDIRYTVHECAQGHGHFVTFYELLREKDCIRPLKGEKLKELRRSVDVVNCSSCGAPVDLHRTAACEHCKAPLAMLDPQAMAETLERLSNEEQRQANPDANQIAADMVLERLQAERTFAQHDRIDRQAWGSSARTFGVLEWAVSALLDALF